MKINTTKIRKWGIEKSLKELKERLEDIEHWSELQPTIQEEVNEMHQILKYWISNPPEKIAK